MLFYPRDFLLSRCLWWKCFTGIQTSRHCSTARHHRFPLDPSTWNTLRTFGILRRSRGKRGGRTQSNNHGVYAINSICRRSCSGKFNIQDVSLRSPWMNTAYKHKRSRHGININNLCYPPRLPLSLYAQRKSTLCLLNCRSVCNKTLTLNDFIIENEIELLCLTETWLNKNNQNLQSIINEITPKGYVFRHVPRNSRGGGVGLVFKKSLELKKIAISKFKSFEIMGMLLNSSPNVTSIFVLYRPPPSNKNKFSYTMFFNEFSQFLEQFSINSASFLLVGDFNFHVEDPTNSHALEFLNILNLFNLTQHVKQPTYKDQHILDLIITNENSNLIDKVSVSDPAISDHSAVFCEILTRKPCCERIVSKCRKIKTIDIESFKRDINQSSLLTSPVNDINGLTLQYHSELLSFLDSHAPLKERIITMRPSVPWYTEEIKSEKVKRRRLERTWRRSRLTIDRDLYVQQCLVVKNLLKKSKDEHFSTIINANKSNQKILFSTFDKWLHKTPEQSFPTAPTAKHLANNFAHFFVDKIKAIQSNFDDQVYIDIQKSLPTITYMSSFSKISCDVLSKLISPLVKKSCDLDPLPGIILKDCIELLLPSITDIVNLSLVTATMPRNLKEAIVKPVLKKYSLPSDEFVSFRPISNLKFLSKVIEKVVATQLVEHLEKNNLHEKFQSAYKRFHSAETALLRVHNDVLQSLDKQSAVILVLLDLSAAFDTVDHYILLERLSTRYGIKGDSHQWFTSYLSDRCFRVKVNGDSSSLHHMECGVPQGSILGPILFILYTSPIGDIMRKNCVDFHLYADDTQLYFSFSTSSPVELHSAKQQIETCLSEIDRWMTCNKLKLNKDKTEILVLSNSNRPRPQLEHLEVSNSRVAKSTSARNIGVIFDETLSLDDHILSVCKTCFFHIHNIWKIRKHLSQSACETLVHALISSKLDFCNSLLYGLPKVSLQKLQYVQNAAARLVTSSRKQEHITPILYNLHWLPVEQRIEFKILLLTFKALQNQAPSYICDLIGLYAPLRTLRSASQNLLIKRTYNYKTYGKRAFSYAAPELWNNLPRNIISSSNSISQFKREVKTYLFKKAFN